MVANWPQSTTKPCGHCCQSISDVPVVISTSWYPCSDLPDRSRIFCSFNCAKARLSRERCVSRSLLRTLGLMAFRMSYRPSHCPSPFLLPHSSDCYCLAHGPLGLFPAPRKETLLVHGGLLSPKEFRQGFWTIQTYSFVEAYFKAYGAPHCANRHSRDYLRNQKALRPRSHPRSLTKKKPDNSVIPPPVVLVKVARTRDITQALLE